MDWREIKVLIVEDDPIIALDIKSLLTQQGAKVAGIAQNGSRALDMLYSLQPNFVLLDIYLGPGMSGIEIAEVIHENYQIPYIFLTSFSDPETVSAAANHSPFGYLVKPFQDPTLLTTIQLAWTTSQKISAVENESLHIQWGAVELTEQQQSIIQHLVAGESYKQIAAAHFISVNTLKYHLKNIYILFDVKSRSELTAKLLKTG